MQKHSTTLAFLLIGVIVFAWMMYAQRKQQAARQQQAQEQTQPASDAQGRPEGREIAPPVVTPSSTVPVIAPTPTNGVPLQDYIVTEGDDLEYRLVWSNRGASLRRARLTDYPQERGSNTGVLILDELSARPLARWNFDAWYPSRKTAPNAIAGGNEMPVVQAAWSPNEGVGESGALVCRQGDIPARVSFSNSDPLTTIALAFKPAASQAGEAVLFSCGGNANQVVIAVTVSAVGDLGASFYFTPKDGKPVARAVRLDTEYNEILPGEWQTLRVVFAASGNVAFIQDNKRLGEISAPDNFPNVRLDALQIGGSLAGNSTRSSFSGLVDNLTLWGIDHLPGTLALRDPQGIHAFDTQNYEVTRENDGRIIFTTRFGDGLRVTKEFTPQPGKNELGVNITFTNEGKDELYARYEIVAAERMKPAGYATPLLFGPVAYRRSNGEVDINLGQPSTGKSWWPFGNKVKMPYTRESNTEEKILWAGAENRYFAAALMAEDSGNIKADDLIFSTRMALLDDIDEITTSRGSVRRQDNLTVAVAPAPAKLSPGQSVTHRYTYFIGPKLQDLLATHTDKGLPAVLDYGMFGIVSRVLLWFLALFNRFVGNYGVGIIMLTILVKACLHPFTRKSQIAMHKMQKLQPLIKELQAKFKGDRQKLGQAQMELMRKHKANPMGGCWPMFFQLPVFLGLFRMLQYSVHLRHAEFFWWIKDLSQPDTIAHISGFPINILPVLMVISWLFQSMSQPKSADPQQAQTQKMMMFMPIMFGFMLYGMASGLTLYWLTSTSVGIIEQRWIKRQIAQMDAEGAFAAEDDELEEAKTRKQKSRTRPKRK